MGVGPGAKGEWGCAYARACACVLHKSILFCVVYNLHGSLMRSTSFPLRRPLLV